ncbi:Transmembrane domain-containing protein [Spironucleus salmonicida]|uniref:Transmembrane domain-containing protein n=1 Tax=Spironucleus salmonicida TaxID=348837 RepID=V6LCL1_9EUKA|nr:Transmembrane domain-containing protein [Spironucleus salmonicida]|eukprot:EST42182.1 Transmembrane domain-containing protein [Spironucleus salmonicida]
MTQKIKVKQYQINQISAINKLLKIEYLMFRKVFIYFNTLFYALFKQPFVILKLILQQEKQHQINFFFIKVTSLIISGLLFQKVPFSFIYHLMKNQNITRIQGMQALIDPIILILQYNLQNQQSSLYVQFSISSSIVYILCSCLMTAGILLKFVSMTIILLDGSFDIISMLVNAKFSEIRSVLIQNLNPGRQYKLFFQDSFEIFNMIFTLLFMNLLFEPSLTSQVTYICFELLADAIKIIHTLDFNKTSLETIKQMKLADENYYCLTEVKFTINPVSYISIIIYLSQYFNGFYTIQSLIGFTLLVALIIQFYFSKHQPIHKDVIEVEQLSKITLCSAP